METPQWAMMIAFWLHMLATVVWLGGQAALSLLVLPIGRKRPRRISGTAARPSLKAINLDDNKPKQ